MIDIRRSVLSIISIIIFLFPAFSLANGDYEEGDGWVYRDGTLTITENGGLKDYVSNDQDEQTGEWKYDHSVWDVKTLVIGKNVTELKNEIYEWNQLEPEETMIESGNTCFIIDHGWVVNTKTKTLFGAAAVPAMKVRTKIDDLPNYIEYIGDGAFYEYRVLTSVTLPQGVVEIGERAFNLCVNLESVAFSDALQTIDDRAFESCFKLSEISLGKNTQFIRDMAFDSCYSLEHILIHSTNITKISERSFSSCNQVLIIELPETVTEIEAFSLCACKALTTLVISADQVMFDDYALYNCVRVDRIVFLNGKPLFPANGLFGETQKTPDGRYYYPDLTDMKNVAIPYPTLYYTAAYASEWAPNGETEWNGYPIQQISQEDLDAILAEARGEAATESVTLSPAPSLSPTTVPASTLQPDATSADASAVDGWIVVVAAVATIAVGTIVFSLMRKKKNK